MSTTVDNTLESYCLDVARRAKRASVDLACATSERKVDWLRRSAKALRQEVSRLLAANEKDLAAAESYNLSDAQVDRLRLTPARIEGIAQALENVSKLPDPVGEVIEST